MPARDGCSPIHFFARWIASSLRAGFVLQDATPKHAIQRARLSDLVTSGPLNVLKRASVASAGNTFLGISPWSFCVTVSNGLSAVSMSGFWCSFLVLPACVYPFTSTRASIPVYLRFFPLRMKGESRRRTGQSQPLQMPRGSLLGRHDVVEELGFFGGEERDGIGDGGTGAGGGVDRRPDDWGEEVGG